jgi:uncharacterized protein
MIERAAVERFLEERHIAVVGASDDDRNFGKTIVRELRKRDYDVVAVNRNATSVDGTPCYPDVAALPDDIDGVIVMVGRDKAAGVVRECAARGVKRVWLFKGLGSPGSVSDDAVQACDTYGIDVVAGACPLMFLEPVGWFHRVHRALARVGD